jgi:hypothetical protein
LGDNFLSVQEFSTVTLAEDVDSASHTVVVEDVLVKSGGMSKPAKLIVEDQSIIDDLRVERANARAVFEDTDRLVGSVTHNTRVGNLVVADTGLVTVQARNESPTSAEARKLIINALDMGTPTAPAGTLDLEDNVVIIDYAGSSLIDAIDSLITSGYSAAANPNYWTGSGITSSTAAAAAGSATYKTGVGFAENVTGGSDGLALTTFEGQSVDSTTVLIKYTYYGDCNLSGQVGLPDFNRVAGNFGQSPRRWVHGDFNFDNAINLTDFNSLAANFGQGALGPGDGEYQGWDMSWEDLMKVWEELTS